jgi:predicted RND superfamily exporter protein
VGSTVLIVALDELSEREATQTFPLAVLGSLLVLAVLLRSPRAMAAVAASSGVAVLLTLGIVVATGGSLNMLTAALPSLLWVLGLSYAVHLVSRVQRLDVGLSRAAALDRAIAETRTGVAFSAITTVLGFGSLLVATMPPVRELGVFGAVGIGLAWLCSRTVAPLLVELLRVPRARRRAGPATTPARLPFPLRAPTVVLAVAAVVALGAVASVPRIRLESNPLSFLPDDHPVTADYRFVGSRVAGFYTAETVVRLPGPWTDPASWPALDGIARELAASPIVSRVVTPLDLLRKLQQWDQGFDPAAYRLPAGQAEAERLVGQLDATGHAVLASLVAPSGREVRLSAVVREMDERQFLGLVQGARESLARLPAGFDGYTTGQVLRLVTAQQNLIATQLGSLGLAFAVIFAAIWVGLRSARLTGVAIPPNLLPVAVVFAAMAWLDIPLDAGTVMVASVSLGISVDNTIHYLVEYRRALASGSGRREAAGAALALVRPAITAATIAACTGFAALTVSAFRPVRYFGLLATVMMAVGLAAHLLVTPAILALRRRGTTKESAP